MSIIIEWTAVGCQRQEQCIKGRLLFIGKRPLTTGSCQWPQLPIRMIPDVVYYTAFFSRYITMNICRRPLTIASYLCNRQNITLWMIMTMKMRKQKNYWIVHGFTSLSESVFCISYRGYHLPLFPTSMIIWKLAMSKKFPCQITFHNNKSSSGRNQTRLDGRTKTVRLNRTMYNSGIRGRWGCSTNWRSSFLPRN